MRLKTSFLFCNTNPQRNLVKYLIEKNKDAKELTGVHSPNQKTDSCLLPTQVLNDMISVESICKRGCLMDATYTERLEIEIWTMAEELDKNEDFSVSKYPFFSKLK